MTNLKWEGSRTQELVANDGIDLDTQYDMPPEPDGDNDELPSLDD